jgi:hypothetical protein
VSQPPRAGGQPTTGDRPLNAVLNLIYRLAGIEARPAALVVGVDAGLGIVHVSLGEGEPVIVDLGGVEAAWRAFVVCGGSLWSDPDRPPSLCRSPGTPCPAVAEVLAHTSTRVTEDLYQHVTPGMKADATAERFARTIWAECGPRAAATGQCQAVIQGAAEKGEPRR